MLTGDCGAATPARAAGANSTARARMNFILNEGLLLNEAVGSGRTLIGFGLMNAVRSLS
jgi:hypothetical protein